MYCRYHLSVRLNNDFIFERRFPSINQAIKCACGFKNEKLTLNIFDDLHQSIMSNDRVLCLCKEFIDGEIYF